MEKVAREGSQTVEPRIEPFEAHCTAELDLPQLEGLFDSESYLSDMLQQQPWWLAPTIFPASDFLGF